MKIRVSLRNNALCVRASGRLSESTAAELFQEIQKELAPLPRDVVLNFAGLEAMDAQALPYVFRIQSQAGRCKNRMMIVNTPEPVRRLFDRTHVNDQLEFFDNEEDALQSVTATANR